MNTHSAALQQIAQGLVLEFPNIRLDIDPAGVPQGSSFIDIHWNVHHVVVEMKDQGFNLFTTGQPDFDTPPDLHIKDHIVTLAKLIQLLKEPVNET